MRSDGCQAATGSQFVGINNFQPQLSIADMAKAKTSRHTLTHSLSLSHTRLRLKCRELVV